MILQRRSFRKGGVALLETKGGGRLQPRLHLLHRTQFTCQSDFTHEAGGGRQRLLLDRGDQAHDHGEVRSRLHHLNASDDADEDVAAADGDLLPGLQHRHEHLEPVEGNADAATDGRSVLRADLAGECLELSGR